MWGEGQIAGGNFDARGGSMGYGVVAYGDGSSFSVGSSGQAGNASVISTGVRGEAASAQISVGVWGITTYDSGYSGFFEGGLGTKITSSEGVGTGTAEGTVRFDSDGHFYGWNGSAWVQLDN